MVYLYRREDVLRSSAASEQSLPKTNFIVVNTPYRTKNWIRYLEYMIASIIKTIMLGMLGIMLMFSADSLGHIQGEHLLVTILGVCALTIGSLLYFSALLYFAMIHVWFVAFALSLVGSGFSKVKSTYPTSQAIEDLHRNIKISRVDAETLIKSTVGKQTGMSFDRVFTLSAIAIEEPARAKEIRDILKLPNIPPKPEQPAKYLQIE